MLANEMEKVVVTDESMFEVFRSSKRKFVRHTQTNGKKNCKNGAQDLQWSMVEAVRGLGVLRRGKIEDLYREEEPLGRPAAVYKIEARII